MQNYTPIFDANGKRVVHYYTDPQWAPRTKLAEVIEIDEDQHRGRLNDLQRALDIAKSKGNDVRTVFIRANPNRYRKGGKRRLGLFERESPAAPYTPAPHCRAAVAEIVKVLRDLEAGVGPVTSGLEHGHMGCVSINYDEDSAAVAAAQDALGENNVAVLFL
jgi:hypothetical protein